MDNSFNYRPDWENDGHLILSNAKTLDIYHALNEERRTCDLKRFDMFCAFTDEQFEKGAASIRPLREGEKYVHYGAGIFGTRDGIKSYLAYSRDINDRIAKECDPQEVYCYEYNNFESCINYEGDLDAIRVIRDIFGIDVAHRIKRMNAFYDLDDLD